MKPYLNIKTELKPRLDHLPLNTGPLGPRKPHFQSANRFVVI